MFIAPDDAKTDVILVGALLVFGRALARIVTGLPLYPSAGSSARILNVLWVVALTALVPVLLARYREDGAAAFRLDGPRTALGSGVVLAIPVAAVGVLPALLAGGAMDGVLLGRIGPALLPVGGPDPLLLLVTLARVAALSVGVLLAVSFLSVRARDGFPRSPEVPLTQLVRTVGLAVVGAATVLGLLNALQLRSASRLIELIVAVIAIALLLVLVDRRVDAAVQVPRATILAPVTVVTVAYVLAAGGLFRGDLLIGLLTAALALGVTVAIAALAHTRAGTWAAVPLVIAAHWWATPLSPWPPI